MAVDSKALKVLKVSGVPCSTQVYTLSWVPGWIVALLLLIVLKLWITSLVYYAKTVTLPEKAIHVSVEAKGCDVLFESSTYSYSWARLGYWKGYGTGDIDLSDKKLTVSTDLSRKEITSNCILRIALTEKAKLGNVVVKVKPDHHAITNPKPSNIAEAVAVKFKHVHAKKVTLSITAAAESIVQGVQADKLDMEVSGGTLTIIESANKKMTDSMKLDAKDATVEVALHSKDVDLTLDENSKNTTSMAAAKVTSKGDGYHLAVGSKASSSATKLNITSDNSAIYVMAADHKHMTSKDLSLDVQPSAVMSQGDVTFLPNGFTLLNNLKKWLKQNTGDKFMVYMGLTTPNAPEGDFQLLSAEVYTAFSVTLFSMFSTGMLQPTIERLQLPVVGFPEKFLWPRRKVDGELSKEQKMKFSMDVFEALSAVIDVKALGLDSAVWVWDTPGRDYIFSQIPGRHGEPGKWVQKPITTQDNMPFYTAAMISVGLGLMAGIVVCYVLHFTVKPTMMRKIRKMRVESAATYRLNYAVYPSTFNLNTCFVHWPEPGVIIRWQKREMSDMFTSMTFAARSWPEPDVVLAKEGVDPWRIPFHPDCPNQRIFFFASQPPKIAESVQLSLLTDKLDQELWGMAQLRVGDKHLNIGTPMQFRISAYAGEKLLEQSSWSRPTMILPERAFTEYPFLLWKANMGVLPDDTFQYFLDRHLMPLDDVPKQVLTIAEMKLYAVSDSELFIGEFEGKYGEDVVAKTCMNYLTCTEPIDALQDMVTISGSTEGLLQEVDDSLYVAASCPLPRASSSERQPKTFEQIFEREPSPKETELAKLKYITLDFGDQKLPLETGPRLDAMMLLEACVIKSDGTSLPFTGKYETTWGEFESIVVGSYGKLDTQVILRDGLKAVGILKGVSEFSNTRLPKPEKETYSDGFPRIFKHIYQGAVFQWGQINTLSWNWEDNQVVDQFDIVLVSEGIHGPAVPDSIWMAKPKENVVASKVSGAAGKVTFTMTPDQPYYVQTIRCHLEVRKVNEKSVQLKPLASSSDFVITRPVTIESLELGYSAFCIGNNIPQNSLTRTRLLQHGIRICEREMYMAAGYRAPMPTPYELDKFANDKGMDTIVKNQASFMITGSAPLAIKVKKEATKEAGGSSTPASSTSAGLATPLLQAEEAPPEEVETIETVQPQRTYVDMPLNLFWNYKGAWREEFLLWYSCLPNFAMDGYMSGIAREYEYDKLAICLAPCDDLVRTVTRVFLFLVQILWLWLPALLVFFLADYHDRKFSSVAPKLSPLDRAAVIYLEDWTLNPIPFQRRWGLLDADGKIVMQFILTYLTLIVATTFYCNFLYSNAGKHWIWNFFFNISNFLITALSVLSLFCLIVFFCMLAIWMVLGALIDPIMIPIAIAILGVALLVKMNWGNLMTMKDHVESIIFSQLDLVLHAIMEVFVGPPDSDQWLDMQAQSNMSADIVELLNDMEKNITKPLLDQSKIKLDVQLWEVDDVEHRRNSVQFKQFATDIAADKCLSTDFLPESIRKAAQKIANDDATINGTRAAYDTDADFQPDNDLTVKSLNTALALRSQSLVPVPGTITQAQKTELDAIAKSMKLRKQTAHVLFKAFILAAHLSESAEDKLLKSAYNISFLMAGIRKDQLFTHFVVPKDEKPEAKKDGAPAAPAAKKDPPPTPAEKSTMNKYMKELQNADMSMFTVYVAKSMTKLLDWNTVGRNAIEWVHAGIVKTLVRRTVDMQLNNYAASTTAFDTMHNLYKFVYDNFDSKYSKNEMQIFPDLGLVDDEYFAAPACKAKLHHILDSQRDVFGLLYQGTMLAAIKNYFFPLLHTASTTDFVEPCFLWYGAFKSILESCGWTADEMEEKWLKYKWNEATEGSGLLPYNNTEEVIEFIMHLADDGLWQAAAKCVMIKVKTYGYAHCDISLMDGKEQATKEAHALYLDPDKQQDLKYLGSTKWPDYVKDAWEKQSTRAKVTDSSVVGPKFLSIPNIDDFLMECVYMPEKKDSEGNVIEENVNLTQLNALDILDQDKCVDDDGYLWHRLPSGKRRLRGIWLELAFEMFELLDCVPSDLDVFYDNLEYQSKKTSKMEPVLQMNPASKWLKEEYLPTMVDACSFDQFMGLLKMVNCDIPADVLKAQVFAKCPLVPGDDLGELRYLTDLGAALRLWIGFGLWKGGIACLINLVMPPSPMRRMAHQMLSDEFNALDKDGIGVLQPAQTLVLMHKLSHPGLTVEDIQLSVKEHLGLEIPERKLHAYFSLMDVNCDGVMQAEEFIPMMRLIMVDYFPEYILTNMGLSWKFILFFIIILILVVVGILMCVQLVVATFTNGTVATAIHSGFNSIVLALGKMQSDAGSGFNDSVSQVKKYLSGLCMDTICAVMGLGKPVVQKIQSIMKQGI